MRRARLLLPVVLVAVVVVSALPKELPSGRRVFASAGRYVYEWRDDPMTGWPTGWPILGPFQSWVANIAVNGSYIYATIPYDNKIVRASLDGSDETLILDDKRYYPYDLAFDPDGNLWFSTFGRKGSQEGTTQGIWRIEGGKPGASPTLVIPPEYLADVDQEVRGYSFNGATRIGFRGEAGSLYVSGVVECLVARADPPDYSQLHRFIEHSEHVEGPEGHFAFTPTGDTLFMDWLGGEIERYDKSGEWVSTFATMRSANRIVIDTTGTVYATGQLFRGGQAVVDAFFILSPNGHDLMTIAMSDVLGVAVYDPR